MYAIVQKLRSKNDGRDIDPNHTIDSKRSMKVWVTLLQTGYVKLRRHKLSDVHVTALSEALRVNADFLRDLSVRLGTKHLSNQAEDVVNNNRRRRVRHLKHHCWNGQSK
jgi:hypothetical protein